MGVDQTGHRGLEYHRVRQSDHGHPDRANHTRHRHPASRPSNRPAAGHDHHSMGIRRVCWSSPRPRRHSPRRPAPYRDQPHTDDGLSNDTAAIAPTPHGQRPDTGARPPASMISTGRGVGWNGRVAPPIKQATCPQVGDNSPELPLVNYSVDVKPTGVYLGLVVEGHPGVRGVRYEQGSRSLWATATKGLWSLPSCSRHGSSGQRIRPTRHQRRSPPSVHAEPAAGAVSGGPAVATPAPRSGMPLRCRQLSEHEGPDCPVLIVEGRRHDTDTQCPARATGRDRPSVEPGAAADE